MNKEQIMEAMDHIDPALIEAADRSTFTAKHTRRGWARPAVIAASLCLILAGTAVAAELFGVQVVEFFNDEFRSFNGGEMEGIFSGYSVEGDVTYFPVDTLSPEIIELDQTLTKPVGKHFSSWEKMEEFVGVDLMENPVLKEAPAGILIDLGVAGAEGHYVAVVNADKDIGVPYISMWGTYSLHNRQFSDASGSHEERMYVTVQADLLTERWGKWDLPARHSLYYDEGIEITQEEYTAPSGLCAHIFRADYPAEETVMTDVKTGETEPITLSPFVRYTAEFLLNGMMFSVSVDGNSRLNSWECNSELLRETLLEVLDGFVYAPAD